MTTFTHATRIAPGCHGGPFALGAVISRHRSLEAAQAKCERNDRLVVVDYDDDVPGNEIIYIADSKGHPTLGTGRYGR